MLNKEVIVIGAGLGGLFSAALLSKEGMKVTVIEKTGSRVGECKVTTVKVLCLIPICM